MRSDWMIGTITTVLAIVAGTISFDYVNRRYPDRPAQDIEAKTATEQKSSEPDKPSVACVDSEGAWKNWSFPNVPMLSPKCETAR